MKLFIFIFLLSSFAFGEEPSNLGIFSGRIFRVHKDSRLVRLETDFENLKYLNKKNKLEFWHEKNSKLKCEGYVVGKSPNFLLLKVPQMEQCKLSISFTKNSYLKFYSEDLLKNISIGRELIDLLLKKQIALQSKVARNKKNLDIFIEKAELINQNYANLIADLEKKRNVEIAKLEEERSLDLKRYYENQRRLEEVNFKLQQYEVADENLTKDRWSLDPRLYIKK